MNNTNCCVYGCHSKKGKNPNISFHKFPKPKACTVQIENKFGKLETVDSFKAWEMKLLMGKPVTNAMRVCSLHFSKENFFFGDIPTQRPRLRKTAVPSKNLPTRKQNVPYCEKQKVARYLRLQERRQKLSTKSLSETMCVQSVDEIGDQHEMQQLINDPELKRTEEDEIAANALLQLAQIPSQQKTFSDKATSVKSGDLVAPFINVIDNNVKLSTLTGLPSLELLESIVTLCKRFNNDVRQRKLTLKERIVLTFMKMKTGLKYVVLSIIFNVVTPNTCRLIFHDTICLLAKVLKPVIRFPTLEECRQNLPKCFLSFPTVRVVLDCTELPVSTPKCLCCRLKTYSHYKGRHTIKFMTGVTPAGMISFISLAYGGRASDKSIFEESGLLQKLTMGRDSIMVDKGFLIDEMVKSYKINLIRPPFLESKSQLSKQEALKNIEIARARVHIERCNQRIKVFEIFQKPLLWSLVPIIDEIFTVACSIVNLSTPILADDKF